MQVRSTSNAERAGPLAALGEAMSWREWARDLAIAVIAGAFLALVGALGTNELPLAKRFLYWMPLMVGGAVVGEFVARYVSRIPRIGASRWLFGVVLAVVVSVPITLIVWSYTAFIFEQKLVIGHLPYQFGPVLLISAAMTGLMLLVSEPGRVTHAPAAGAAAQPVRFLDRLPAKLKGGALYAVSSEDHYLRLHTSKGGDLILMRLSDAIAELEGMEGAQTHRSWWVARDAVESARRDGDKVVLRLKGDIEAPVSRANVRPLREAGWF